MTLGKNHCDRCTGCTTVWRRTKGPKKFTGKETLVSHRERIKWKV